MRLRSASKNTFVTGNDAPLIGERANAHIGPPQNDRSQAARA
jgi:hypothetical protein